ncbi:MAG: hypothetical protein K2X87_08015, partial [Gemmataceae bacterium]|nr:hypothetical protein [Gemmataceae bacterium]
TAGEKTRIWVLVVLGLVLNLAAVGLAVAWWSGALDPKPEAPPDPAPSVTPKKPDRPPRVRKAKPAEPEPDPDEVRD